MRRSMMGSRCGVLLGLLLLLLLFAAQTSGRLSFEQEPESRMVNGDESGRWSFRCLPHPPQSEVRWWVAGKLHPKKGEKVVVQRKQAEEPFQCEIRHQGRAMMSAPARIVLAELHSFAGLPDVHISALSGNTAVVPCDPPHSVPNVVTEFLFNDTAAEGQDKLIDKTEGHYHLMPSGDLQIFDVRSEHSGEYECVAYNPFLGKKIKSNRKIFLHVEAPSADRPAAIIKSPRAKMSVSLYSNVTVECAATGHPTPTVTWRRHDGRNLSRDRFHQISGNLVILGVRREDEDVYYCEAQNSQGETESRSTTLQVQESPEVLRLQKTVNLESGGNLSLTCQARGNPKPTLKWLHNAKEIQGQKKAHLTIANVTARDAGIYQCFASSPLGTAYASSVVNVDKQDAEGRSHKNPDDEEEEESRRFYGRRHHKKKHMKGVKLIPPSKPDLSRLSDQSVMVRWSVGGGGGGLPIRFFKVQWREVEGRGDWMTVDEDIAAHIHSYAVVGLRTGGVYRFRVAAVYSNHDNKIGPVSNKFVLTRDMPLERLANSPLITRAEAASPSAITLHWQYEEGESVEGFFLHYRASHSADKYLKEVALGQNTRSHIISHLLPDTGYDVKMQSFNRAGTSHFSNIVTCKTRVSDIVVSGRSRSKGGSPPPTSPPSAVEEEEDSSLPLPYIVAGAGGGLLVVCAAACLILIRRKKKKKAKQRGDKLGNGHVSSNGYLPAPCNISVNPLSQLDSADKPDDIEVVISNNNEIIRLQTFSANQQAPLLNGEKESCLNGEQPVIATCDSDEVEPADL